MNYKQFMLGISALTAGVAEYLFHRPPAGGFLGAVLEKRVTRSAPEVDIFGPFAGAAPEFFHPLSFALITLSLIPEATKRVRAAVCLGWLSVELCFEMGQALKPRISGLADRFDLPGGISAVTDYFANGTYDPMDVAALSAGALVAYATSGFTRISTLASKGGMNTHEYV